MQTQRWTTVVIMVLAAAVPAVTQGLLPPVKVEAGGEPIDVDVGHAAPWVQDIDGDGRRDLLVGEFRGRLRIYRNVGEDDAPRFDAFTWLHAGGAEATVPSG